MEHHLNVLHLDADTVWFANPYPLFKTLYASYSLIIQSDNPFVNAGILYVQNVADGDAAAWVLQELNRRIARFTYEPASVRSLPHSSWSTAPHFANADEQANLNDIVTSALIGRPSFTAGVEFYEARFKRDRGDAYARQLMANRGWGDRMLQGDVRPARSGLRTLRPDRVFEPLVHLCKPDLWVGVSTAKLAVPNNSSAPRRQLLLAPEWLFSHFPYGGGPSAPPPAFLPLPTPVCMPACVRACACSLLSVVSRLPRRLLGLRGSLSARAAPVHASLSRAGSDGAHGWAAQRSVGPSRSDARSGRVARVCGRGCHRRLGLSALAAPATRRGQPSLALWIDGCL